MFSTIIEILFLGLGVWLIFTGKIPDKLFNFLFGKGQYHTSPANARLFGLLLASPLPVVFGVSSLLGLVFGQNSLQYSFIFETVYFIIVALMAIFIVKKFKQPDLVP